MSVKRLSQNALFTAVALGIFVLEAQLPPLTPIPGIKLGLANAVTLFALVFLTSKDAFLILLARILLGSLFAAAPSVLLYSLPGGIAALWVEILLLRYNSVKFLWGVSSVGALTHNMIQLLIAALVTRTPAVFAYLPLLGISGIVTGLFTGLSIRYLHHRAGNQLRKILH